MFGCVAKTITNVKIKKAPRKLFPHSDKLQRKKCKKKIKKICLQSCKG